MRTVPGVSCAMFTMITMIAFLGCDRTDAPTPAEAAVPAATQEAHADEGHAHGQGNEDAHGDDHAHGAHADEIVLTPQAIRNNGIRIATAKKQQLAASVVAPARVAYNAEQVAHVGSAVTGRVREIKARVGDHASEGAPLLVVESAQLGEAQSDYLQKRTSVEVAGPAVELARSSYERARELYEKNQGIALTEVQRRQAEYQAAQGNLKSANAALTASENRLHLLGMSRDAVQALAKSGEIDPTYVIRAPIDGRVIEREATLGELVGPDKQRLIVLANLDPIWIVADVPEAKLAAARVGAAANIALPSLASALQGKVAYVAAEIDPSTRTARVRIETPNESGALLPGMFATVEITATDAEEAVVAVPDEAIQTVDGEPAVFVPVEGEPNTFAKRQVAVGAPVGGMVPIYAGLKEGQQYVAAGSFVLKAELGKAGAGHGH